MGGEEYKELLQKGDIVQSVHLSLQSGKLFCPAYIKPFQLGHRISTDTNSTAIKYGHKYEKFNVFYERYYGLESKEWKKNLWEIHPGKLPLSELVETMKPVSVPGFENVANTEGIHGAIEGVHFNIQDNPPVLGKQVMKNGLVWVHYALFLEGSNIPFDSSLGRRHGKPEHMVASPSAVLPYMALALCWLKVGQRGRFVLPPSVYGPLGLYGTVPPNTSVLMLLHVMKAVDFGSLHRYNALDDETKKDFDKVLYYIQTADEIAKDFYYVKKMYECVESYKQAVDMLMACNRTQANSDMINQLLLKNYVNLALSITKDRRGNPEHALHFVECASNIAGYDTNCKAHFLRGKCHLILKHYEEAKKYLLEAYRMEPFNEEVGEQLEKLEEALLQSDTVERTMAKKYANREVELDMRDVKIREQFLNREDADKVKKCVETIEKTYGTICTETWPLLPVEREILRNLDCIKKGTFYTHKL